MEYLKKLERNLKEGVMLELKIIDFIFFIFLFYFILFYLIILFLNLELEISMMSQRIL